MYRVYATPPPPAMSINATTNAVPASTTGIYQQSERMSRDKRSKSSFIVHPVIENFLRWQPVCEPWIKATTEGEKKYWRLRTECSIVPVDDDAQKRITLRCHPNFQNEGPWYDWAIVKFETDCFFHHPNNRREFDTKTRQRLPGLEKVFDPIQNESQYPEFCVPCKILAFAENAQQGTTMALVHGCRFRTINRQTAHDTVLLEFWQLECHNLHDELPAPPNLGTSNRRGGRRQQKHYFVPFLSWVDVTSILRRCMVIEEEPGIHEEKPMSKPKKGQPKELNWVMLVREHCLWPEQFTEA